MVVTGILLAAATLPVQVAAANTTTSLDNQTVGWQPGNSHRSTWSIISSSLSTVIACTWSIQHLNVPSIRDGFWTRFGRNCKWMLITILFPEFVVLHAMLEFALAIRALERIGENVENIDYPWWYSGLPYIYAVGRCTSQLFSCRCVVKDSRTKRALPGGSRNTNVGRSVDDEPDIEMGRLNSRIDEPSRSMEIPKWTLTHCFFANMSGIVYHHGRHDFPLTAFQIARARLEDPEITLAEVEDKSKRDWFAKIVATLQSSQLVLSLIVRTAQGLDFSQLETITLGLAVCGALINLLYIYKPHNISTPYKLRRVKHMGKWDSGELIEHGLQPLEFRWTYDSFWNVLLNRPMDQGTMDHVPRIPNDNIPISQNRVAHPAIFLLAVLSGLFGALHAIAWNFEFPTRVERIFWQIATSVSIVSPVIGLIAITPLQRTRSWGNPQNFNNRCVQLFDECLATGISSAVEGGFDDREQRAMQDAVAAARKTLRLTYITSHSDKKREYRPFREVFERLFEQPTPDQPRRHIDTVLLVLEERVRRIRAGGDDIEISRASEFQRQFCSLVSTIKHDGDVPKRQSDEARTNIFPSRTMPPQPFSLSVFVLTSLLYTLSRLSLLAVSLSALRQMPESVYVNTVWTAYIPNIGSST